MFLFLLLLVHGLYHIQIALGQLNHDPASSAPFSRCRIMPGDPEWPNASTWDKFNASVEGRLIRTVPIASVCHGENFDQAQCEFVRSQWHFPALHEPSSSSMMAPMFLNQSCDPFTAVDSQCIIGNYVQYAVNVSKLEHVVKTVKFAKKYNIRFVVRNTGHDYMGKSTGAGALAVWMHHLRRRIWYSSYNASDSEYHGPAVKAYAGVLGDTLAEDAERRGLAVVSGECPSVGFAGGYVQGGGHSILSSIYGMAADQVLAYEVITTDGQFVRASRTANSDLFWALRGGGGGTYGIVWSVTVKAHPDTFVTTARVLFTPSQDDFSLDAHWEGINYFFNEYPTYLDVGAFHVSFFDNSIFQVVVLFPGQTSSEVDKLIKPWIRKLQALQLNLIEASIDQHATTRSSISTLLEMYGGVIQTGTSLYGSRILPKSLWKSDMLKSRLQHTLRSLVNDGGSILNVAFDPTAKISEYPDTAVLPAFRSMRSACMVVLNWNDTASWDDQFSATKKVTALTQRLESIAPDTGAYLNEADAFDPDWKRNFYGENYARLLKIKDKWDPDEMLYGTTAVGGDRWTAGEDGRLCRRARIDPNVLRLNFLNTYL